MGFLGSVGLYLAGSGLLYLIACAFPKTFLLDEDAHNRKLLEELKARDPQAWARTIKTEAYRKYAND